LVLAFPPIAALSFPDRPVCRTQQPKLEEGAIMSGLTAAGAKQGIVVNQKHRPNYYDKSATERAIDKESSVTLPSMGKIKGGLRIGIRIRDKQTIDSLQIHGKNNSLSPQQEGAPYTIATELETICPASRYGDKWVGFTATYDPSTHGGGPFETQLKVYPINDFIDPHGFQTVSIAVTTAGDTFTSGSYLVATSVLPGEESLMIHKAIQLTGGKGSKSSPKGKASGRKKAPKKQASRTRRGKTPKRR
jgi:hypothetical protein